MCDSSMFCDKCSGPEQRPASHFETFEKSMDFNQFRKATFGSFKRARLLTNHVVQSPKVASSECSLGSMTELKTARKAIFTWQIARDTFECALNGGMMRVPWFISSLGGSSASLVCRVRAPLDSQFHNLLSCSLTWTTFSEILSKAPTHWLISKVLRLKFMDRRLACQSFWMNTECPHGGE